MNKNHGDNDAVKREQSQANEQREQCRMYSGFAESRLSSRNSNRLSSAEREHLRDQFVTGRKGTAISTLPQSPFHGISHTKRLACPTTQNRRNHDKQGVNEKIPLVEEWDLTKKSQQVLHADWAVPHAASSSQCGEYRAKHAHNDLNQCLPTFFLHTLTDLKYF